MKPNRLFLVIIVILFGVMLAGCADIMTGSGWPGLTVDDERVYVSYNTGVMALRLSDGALVWRYPEEADAQLTFYAPPSRNGDELIVGDFAQTLHAISLANGTPRWTFSDTNGRFVAGALVVDDLVLAPNTDHTLYALDLQGGLRWKFQTEQALWAKPVSDGELIYQAAMDHHVYALRLSDGSLVWKSGLNGAAMFSPALSEDGMLFVGSLAKEMVALETSGGAVQWRYNTKGPIWSQPLLHNDTLYFGDMEGWVYALDSKTGSARWQMQLTGPVLSAPVVIEENIVLATENGDIQAISSDGQKLWTRSVNGKLYGAPAVADDLVVFGVVQGDNVVVAFDFNGNERWSFVPPK